MKNTFVAERRIEINANPERVWKVLTDPDYISQWDDVPPGFTGQLGLNSQMVWEFEDGHKTILTITAIEPNVYLKMNLFVTRWPRPAETYDIAYIYKLEGHDGQTTLQISVGDFQDLGEKASDYLSASEEFVETGGDKIKALAENNTVV